MRQHEIYTNSAAAARFINAGLVGSACWVHDVSDSEELHCITVSRRYDREEMISLLDRMNVSYVDVVTI